MTQVQIKANLYIGSRFPVNRRKLRETVKRVLTAKGIEKAQVDVSVVGKRKIKELNKKYLRHQNVTDVLSFPQHEKDEVKDFPVATDALPHLGDVVICFPEAVKTARRYGKMVDDQLSFYLEHGLMHLMGYHHD